jgi:hypothetical protein
MYSKMLLESMMRAESVLVQAPIVLGRFTVFLVISALVPLKDKPNIIIAKKYKNAFEENIVINFILLAKEDSVKTIEAGSKTEKWFEFKHGPRI